MEKFLADCLGLCNEIATETSSGVVLEKIMLMASRLAGAEGCLFFEVDADKFMDLKFIHFKNLSEEKIKNDAIKIFEPISLAEAREKSFKNPAEFCAVNKQIVNTDNIYADEMLDSSQVALFDEENGFASMSVLALPLVDRKGNIIGVAEFVNATDNKGKTISFVPSLRNKLLAICNIMVLVLENKNLRASYSQLLESFIEVLARAIDAKSHYTGAHCQRVPIIARMMTNAALEDQQGSLKNFAMTDDDWYSLHIASWLHDCGKVTTPEYIVDKATKLETINNRIHEIRSRFEILRRDAHIAYLQKRLANLDSKENLQAEFVAEVKKLEDDFAFVASCNIGDNILNEDDVKRLEQIAQRKFVRYFNRMLGLSWAEKNAITDPKPYNHPAEETLLQDRPDQIDSLNNKGELYNLKVAKGTINKEEREKINEHIKVTIDMLKALPFPKELASVVEYAGCHHEWVNGKGYPNGLTGEQMSIPARIMAIADVFEALTARDRPYKEPKKLSEVLRIMQEMKNIGHLDPELYRVFVEKNVYMDYAEQYIEKEQIDEVNILELM